MNRYKAVAHESRDFATSMHQSRDKNGKASGDRCFQIGIGLILT